MDDNWLKRRVVLIVVSVASLLAVATIGAAIAHPYIDPNNNTPSILEEWGGLIIGFYFGTLVGLLKDWMSPTPKSDDTDTDQAPDAQNAPTVATPGQRQVNRPQNTATAAAE